MRCLVEMQDIKVFSAEFSELLPGDWFSSPVRDSQLYVKIDEVIYHGSGFTMNALVVNTGELTRIRPDTKVLPVRAKVLAAKIAAKKGDTWESIRTATVADEE